MKYVALHSIDKTIIYINASLIQYIMPLDEGQTAVVTVNTNLKVLETPTEIIRRIYEQ